MMGMKGEYGERADCLVSRVLKTGEQAERMTLWARSASTDPSAVSAARVTSRNWSWFRMSAKEWLMRLSKFFQEMS